MRGKITAIAPDGTYGQLATDDGQRFSYWSNEVRNGQAQVGQLVEFQMQDGQPIEIFIVMPPGRPGAAPAPRPRMPQGMAQGMGQGLPQGMMPAGAAGATGNYWVKLFTSPSGRISRRQFWLHGILPIMGVQIFLSWIPLIGQLIALVALWGSICIAFKRFHDCGYPGWYSLLAYIPLLAGGVFLAASFFLTTFASMGWLLAEILWGIAGIIIIVQFVMVYIRVGQEGPNQYGPDPLAAV